MAELSLLADMAIVLAVALFGALIARSLRLPIIVGYLLVGVAIGPYGLHLIHNVADVETLATIGVVLLMFTLGIEFSLKTLRQIGLIAAFGGVIQIAATTGVGFGLGWLLHWPLRESLLFGFFIAMSSTIIVLKTLMERGELGTTHGRVMIGILLVQDLSIVPLMIALYSMGSGVEAFSATWIWDLLKVLSFMGVILILGFWGFPWFMRRITGGRSSREIFLLTVVCVAFGAGFGAYYVGLSIALGAFLAGLMVSESQYAHQARAEIGPLRDIFAILFFVSLGMLADPSFIWANPGEVGIVVAVIVAGKFLIVSFITWAFGYAPKTALFAGGGLFQIGEFSFILAAVALDTNLISDHIYSLILAAASITMLLTPFGMGLVSNIYHRLIQRERVAKLLTARADPADVEERRQLSGHVVICGYGQVARNLGKVLERRNFPYLVIDIDSRILDPLRARGVPCIYGDAANPDILAQAQLEKARVLVVAFPDPIAARLTVANARIINPRLDVVSRVHREEDSEVLKGLGVARIVRPELEAGLEIVRHTLHRFGLTTQEIQYIVNTLREEQV
jgi:CPA2 family monovalent cation:H+ antiporter-2